MLRTCAICGRERETHSARSRYVCTAQACRDKARPRVPLHGMNPLKQKTYFKILKRKQNRRMRARSRRVNLRLNPHLAVVPEI
jgi:hypothetical protein